MSDMIVIRKQGGSRIIPITKCIPTDWTIIELKKSVKKGDTVTLTFEKVV